MHVCDYVLYLPKTTSLVNHASLLGSNKHLF